MGYCVHCNKRFADDEGGLVFNQGFCSVCVRTDDYKEFRKATVYKYWDLVEELAKERNRLAGIEFKDWIKDKKQILSMTG